ncbi:quercetin dioxygenase-like cupin family protein [Paenibacillus rhizosphaerae]|uniref:Quercetin dioxygenase-like cupin family protein n=1 Tax=Paenibacillus rhizosphaerae TaxID=297318 RepID=A0A839TFA4_9BACL|nr:cupin [Paenibacillus rhizosphaerae]MBB3125381.1 quercetin dioxygenase-like cupin family protein [Paenibacillus rhizosphaerae]
MNIYRFDKQVGRRITAFESVNLVMSKIAQSTGKFHIGCMHLSTNGTIGGHVATVEQLFLVMSGTVEIRSAIEEPWTQLSQGEAVFWRQGEWHETRTFLGAQAIVIECEGIGPNEMALKSALS